MIRYNSHAINKVFQALENTNRLRGKRYCNRRIRRIGYWMAQVSKWAPKTTA